FWNDLDRLLGHIADGSVLDFKCMQVRNHKLWLPDGTALIYDSLEWHVADDGERGWRLKTRGWTGMYSGRLTEHICSSLARAVMMQAALRIRMATGLRPALRVHDELVFAVPAGKADETLKYLIDEMRRTPDWAPGLPLGAEGAIVERYGDAK